MKKSNRLEVSRPAEDFRDMISRLDGEEPIGKLRAKGLILSDIVDVKPPAVKVFTHITAFAHRKGKNLFSDVIQALDQQSKNLGRDISGISIYRCYSDSEGESVIVKHHAKSYHTTQRLTYFLHEALSEHQIRTDSQLAVESTSLQSDDGPFMDGKWGHLEK